MVSHDPRASADRRGAAVRGLRGVGTEWGGGEVKESGMELKLFWIHDAQDKARAFALFAQKMANRLIVGIFRYDKGRPVRQIRYFTRLKAEVRAYERTGNFEYLVNAANYCFLESVAPEHKRAHWIVDHKSVTRDGLKMRFEGEPDGTR